jgi:DNA polymerase III sliding clamp (beta) subunit (PCNA family)
VLLDVGSSSLTAVATDRYRLATVDVDVVVSGPAAAALVPVALVDAVFGLLDAAGEAELVIEGARITVTTDAGTLGGGLATEPFPDYRALLPSGPAAASAPVAAARAAVRAPAADLRPGAGGEVREFTVLDAGPDAMWVDRQFLLEALDAAAEDAVLEFTGPVEPLAIRAPRALALVMPAKPPA